MPSRDSTALGAPIWADLLSSDPDKSQAFYAELFGWTSQSAGDEYGGYINFQKDGAPVAGGMRNDGQSGQPDRWSVYLASDNAKGTADAVVEHGGQVMVPVMEVGPFGTMAIVTDVSGARIGIWQPGEHRGFGALAEPGTPAWFELLTRDYDASVEFYREVFEWDAHTVSDTAEFRYTTLGDGDAAQAGIMDAAAFLADGVPSHWSVYFAVASTDDALAQTVELGGSVLMPAQDTPYGRLAQAADCSGAPFKLMARG